MIDLAGPAWRAVVVWAEGRWRRRAACRCQGWKPVKTSGVL